MASAIELDRAVFVRARLVARTVVEGEAAMVDDMGMAIDPALVHRLLAFRYAGTATLSAGPSRQAA